eukprot:363348-Chlamydomonas_euryale.AAC.3
MLEPFKLRLPCMRLCWEPQRAMRAFDLAASCHGPSPINAEHSLHSKLGRPRHPIACTADSCCARHALA